MSLVTIVTLVVVATVEENQALLSGSSSVVSLLDRLCSPVQSELARKRQVLTNQHSLD